MSAAPQRVAIIGGMFTANKGAASMVQAVMDNLPDVVGPCTFDVLTIYPDDDERERPPGPVRIVAYRPWQLVAVLPLALLVALVRALGGTGRALCVTPALRSLADADVVVDVAGISFADGRNPAILVYNTLMTGIPLLVGAPVVKCSQALGPFRGAHTRAAARLVLPRLDTVVARGGLTEDHLADLGLPNVVEAADLAFTMGVSEDAREHADRLIAGRIGAGPFVALVPSNVVRAYCDEHDIDYVGLLRALVAHVTAGGTPVLAFPHATRPGRPSSRMNDIPLVEELAATVDAGGFAGLDESLPPAVLRALIGRAEVLVTSRFHAMISALTVTTPVLVVGWSHKYDEALRDFGLESWAVDHRELDRDTLITRFDQLRGDAASIRATIGRHLPTVVDRARVNFDAIAQSLAGSGADT